MSIASGSFVRSTGSSDPVGRTNVEGRTPAQVVDDLASSLASAGYMLKSENLSGLVNATARANLGLGSMALESAASFQPVDANLTAISGILLGTTGFDLLQAETAADGRADLGLGSMALQDAGAVAVTGGTVSGVSVAATNLTVDNGVAADGGGLKHSRVTTGSISGGSTALVTITWGTAFADANYTVQASVVDSTSSSLSLSVVHIESITASAVTVRVLNNAIGSLTGTVHVIAIHD